MNKKDKKKKGHSEARLLVSPKEAKKFNLHPVSFWDDWQDYRDGQRNYKDRSLIRPEFIGRKNRNWLNLHIIEDNKKLKKKERIRRVR